MKIKEAVNIINNSSDNIVVAKVVDNDVIEFKRSGSSSSFLRVPIKALAWCSVYKDWAYLYDIEPADLARVMDVVQRLIDTPIKDRFPEKKYVLSAIRCAEGPLAIKQYVDAINISTNNVEFHFGLADEKADAMEFTQKELDDLSDFFPKVAIDAMKEPVEDKTDDND